MVHHADEQESQLLEWRCIVGLEWLFGASHHLQTGCNGCRGCGGRGGLGVVVGSLVDKGAVLCLVVVVVSINANIWLSSCQHWRRLALDCKEIDGLSGCIERFQGG